jgi:PKD repeat protein
MGGVSGMAYTAGKLYYVKNGDANLYWRWFNVDSGIIGADEFTSNGGRNWTGTMGMFAANGKLYFVTKADGNLNSIALTATGPTGASTVVDSPAPPPDGNSGNDWRARALFLVPGNQAPQNTPPTASFPAPSCTDLVCTFDGSSSSDAQGPIAGYAWNFGDTNSGASNTATGQTAAHTFSGAGTYPVKLTVTDGGGLTNSKTTNVTVSVSQAGSITYRGSTTKAANVAAPTVNVPGNVEVGDTLVLTATMSNATSASVPAGWSVVGDTTSSASLRGKVWVHTVANVSERNQAVAVTMDAIHKAALAITAYDGVSTAGVTASPSVDAGATNHAPPQVTVTAGSWVVWAWGEKSPTSNTWTTPSPQRADIHSSASSAVSEAVVDTNGARTGAVPGATASTATASSRGVNWSIILPPQ